MVKLKIISPEDIFKDVVRPFLYRIAQENLKAGRLPGFEGEPKYRAYKLAVTGSLKPLRWKQGREQLAPSLMYANDQYSASKINSDGGAIGSRAPNSNVLFGGINQFGESYPARNPYLMTPHQRQNLMKEISNYIRSPK